MTADQAHSLDDLSERFVIGPSEVSTARRFESHLASTGTTTMPKALRRALGVEHGARLFWQQQADGTILVSLKHSYSEPSLQNIETSTFHREL